LPILRDAVRSLPRGIRGGRSSGWGGAGRLEV